MTTASKSAAGASGAGAAAEPAATLKDVASYVRSKNAGPFWLTIDIFLPDTAAFTRVCQSPVTDPAVIAERYAVAADAVRVFEISDLNVVKISFPRPVVQGSPGDRDMHGGQQFVPLLEIIVA